MAAAGVCRRLAQPTHHYYKQLCSLVPYTSRRTHCADLENSRPAFDEGLILGTAHRCELPHTVDPSSLLNAVCLCLAIFDRPNIARFRLPGHFNLELPSDSDEHDPADPSQGPRNDDAAEREHVLVDGDESGNTARIVVDGSCIGSPTQSSSDSRTYCPARISASSYACDSSTFCGCSSATLNVEPDPAVSMIYASFSEKYAAA
ncbi:hypothetical protein DL89DRAFT_254022 [Linderina pennispora]|uniref:Uncharacterized protein n=1 Tax=Linderina pennispora TaxID=61395 RepID=A0A1Y1WLF9_9FUNG|nr:uncharacterized protein DL89DRAFT_254022 [Linderina pennispora]ORX74138.1 hypothetical protein DL89DRAFT_254022 [Linderina pennispora]